WLGRQPWVVYGLLKTAVANSPNVTSGMIIFTIVGFAVIDVALAVIATYLAWHVIKQGVDEPEHEEMAGHVSLGI
ncbi:MAG: cytochrome ubiquinol oxidase subunit I, partial [Firmicutes bacterium]|nr:cytochrome ubiquinol oxidase subunit I [Bacillota bacterium]